MLLWPVPRSFWHHIIVDPKCLKASFITALYLSVASPFQKFQQSIGMYKWQTTRMIVIYTRIGDCSPWSHVCTMVEWEDCRVHWFSVSGTTEGQVTLSIQLHTSVGFQYFLNLFQITKIARMLASMLSLWLSLFLSCLNLSVYARWFCLVRSVNIWPGIPPPLLTYLIRAACVCLRIQPSTYTHRHKLHRPYTKD